MISKKYLRLLKIKKAGLTGFLSIFTYDYWASQTTEWAAT
jgi:hypothetical protein